MNRREVLIAGVAAVAAPPALPSAEPIGWVEVGYVSPHPAQIMAPAHGGMWAYKLLGEDWNFHIGHSLPLMEDAVLVKAMHFAEPLTEDQVRALIESG